jgi:hypothetical protein
LKEVGNIVDKFHVSYEEKAQIKIALAEAANRQEELTQRGIESRFQAVTRIIQAEMAQGDTYTKRARPTVVYAGLILFAVQVVSQFWGVEIQVPPDFTYAWAGVVGVWMIGRSYEKAQGAGTVSGLITGTKPLAVPEL